MNPWLRSVAAGTGRLGLVGLLASGHPARAVAGPATAASRPTEAAAKPGRPPGHGMVVAGVAITLGSVVAYGLLGAGLGVGNRAEADVARLRDIAQAQERRDALGRGRLGNRLAIAGAVGAVVAAGIGIPLIVIGRRRATANPAGKRAAKIEIGPAGAGAFVRLRM